MEIASTSSIVVISLIFGSFGVSSQDFYDVRRCSPASGKVFQIFVTAYADNTLEYGNRVEGRKAPVWKDAKAKCEEAGAKLATISNRAEQRQMEKAIKTLWGSATKSRYWIGIQKTNLPMHWISDEELTADSKLKFAKDSYWNEAGTMTGTCGSIHKKKGIDFDECDANNVSGYVCEFQTPSCQPGNE